MGVGGEKKPMREIDDTRGAANDDRFEMILEQIRQFGKIIDDEEAPLYDDIGDQEIELGLERVVHFEVPFGEFKLTRKIENYRISGSGRHKNAEPLSPPRSHLHLKKRDPHSGEWLVIDFEDLF